jgi:pectate lyase
VGVDDTFSEELTNACGFPVTVTVDAHETHLFFEDQVQVSIHYNATITGNGKTILLRNNDLEIETAQSVTIVGVPFRVLDAEGKTLVKDAGFLYFSFEDGTLVLHGPHPGLNFDLCAALQ